MPTRSNRGHRRVGRGAGALGATLMLLAVACGGAPSGEAATLRMQEFLFDPDQLVASGPGVEIVVRNDGAVTHDWTLLRRSVATEADITDDLIIERVIVRSGDSAAVSLDDLPAGRYQYVCAIPGHFTLGMHGTLEVAGE